VLAARARHAPQGLPNTLLNPAEPGPDFHQQSVAGQPSSCSISACQVSACQRCCHAASASFRGCCTGCCRADRSCVNIPTMSARATGSTVGLSRSCKSWEALQRVAEGGRGCRASMHVELQMWVSLALWLCFSSTVAVLCRFHQLLPHLSNGPVNLTLMHMTDAIMCTQGACVI